ncbi:MAG: hypothetical protein KDB53_13555 [Planctomycetes bacterium]|nr:hypothetical protein [Planctomycetota bacterium]
MTRPEELDQALEELPRDLRFAFAPLVKRALGFAVGATLGLGLAIITAYHLAFAPESGSYLWLFRHYFAGYDPESWGGPFVGFLWGMWTGFVMGWFLAAVRNFVVAVWIFVVRTRANLRANRDFLDHI